MSKYIKMSICFFQKKTDKILFVLCQQSGSNVKLELLWILLCYLGILIVCPGFSDCGVESLSLFASKISFHLTGVPYILRLMLLKVSPT